MPIHCACKLKGKTGRETDVPLFRFDMELLGRAITEAGDFLQHDPAEIRKEGLNASLAAWRSSVVIQDAILSQMRSSAHTNEERKDRSACMPEVRGRN